MRVLVACEESQVVTMAFREMGHDAFSCDIKECTGGFPKYHIKGDVLKIINDGWDLMIGHPPCTFISYAGTAHWNAPGRLQNRLEALDFFAKLWLAPIDKICLENPKGCASPTIAKYTQEIQPYFFGDDHIKTTWLWLKNLEPLQYELKPNLFNSLEEEIKKPDPIYIDKSGKKRYFAEAMKGTSDRQTARSKTFKGIANAMAKQWG